MVPDPTFNPDAVRWDERGLVPAVVQDAGDGRVLMLGYVDSEALRETLRTGEVHFHSRSRDRLWRKGETSGNVLLLRSAALDCDGDTLLLTVDPAGPTCHRGTRSCFDPEVASAQPPTQGFAWLEELWATIGERAQTRPPVSYTARLLDSGVDAVGRKVTEEATELLIAAKNDADADAGGTDRSATRSAFTNEAADLLYHVLVLLAARGLDPSAVVSVLRERHARPPQPFTASGEHD
jgi:phosphoribosyl-ATP pyrophosphohydrolase/phosphoribosyl-AMP cyclohydrolase